MDFTEFFFRCLFGFIIITLIIFLISAPWIIIKNIQADTICASHGYPSDKWTSDGWYCYRIVNQSTDMIKMPMK